MRRGANSFDVQNKKIFIALLLLAFGILLFIAFARTLPGM